MSIQEIGIFAKTFDRQCVEDNLNAVAAHQLPVVQYNMACAGLASMPEYIAPDLAERIALAARSRGIRIAALSGTFNMIHPDRSVRQTGLQRLRVLAEACATLGTRTITLCTGTRDPDEMWHGHAANHDAAAWSDLLASLEVAVSVADELDLSLGIEPETANVVDSAARALTLLREMRSPRLRIVLDAANLFGADNLSRQLDVLDEAIDLLGPYLIMAHAKDVQVVGGQVRHVAAGNGLLDYPHYLKLLRNLPVPLVVHGLSEDEVPGSLSFLRALSDAIL